MSFCALTIVFLSLLTLLKVELSFYSLWISLREVHTLSFVCIRDVAIACYCWNCSPRLRSLISLKGVLYYFLIIELSAVSVWIFHEPQTIAAFPYRSNTEKICVLEPESPVLSTVFIMSPCQFIFLSMPRVFAMYSVCKQTIRHRHLPS